MIFRNYGLRNFVDHALPPSGRHLRDDAAKESLMRFTLKTRYGQDVDLFEHNVQRFWYALLAVFVVAAPFLLDDFYTGELALVFFYAIAGIGLMLLVGYTGLVSLGHAAFLAIGAYAHAYFMTEGAPFIVSLVGATAVCVVIGAIVGIPSLRMTGIYLAVATLAFAQIVEKVLAHWESGTGGHRGMAVPDPEFLSWSLGTPRIFYFVVLFVLVAALFSALNLLRSPTGRAMIAIRDSEISAQAMGIHLARVKSTAGASAAGFTGLAGGLFAHQIGYLAPDAFTILISIQLLLMVVVGGLGSLHGVIYGAIFIGLLPQGIVREDCWQPKMDIRSTRN